LVPDQFTGLSELESRSDRGYYLHKSYRKEILWLMIKDGIL
jgi:hypothetical protein